MPPELQNFSDGSVGADLLKGDWLGTYRKFLRDPVNCPYGGTASGTKAKPLCPSGFGLAEERRQLRNSIIDAIIAKIDIEYFRYSSGLQIGNGYIGLAGDLATLGLNSAGGIVGDAGLKSILAVTAAGVTGTTASIDKRLFLDQSRQAIVATMNGSRAKTRGDITTLEKNDVATYTIEAALSDLQSYYASGTITNAFLTIQTKAGLDKNTGDNTILKETPGKGKALDVPGTVGTSQAAPDNTVAPPAPITPTPATTNPQ